MAFFFMQISPQLWSLPDSSDVDPETCRKNKALFVVSLHISGSMLLESGHCLSRSAFFICNTYFACGMCM